MHRLAVAGLTAVAGPIAVAGLAAGCGTSPGTTSSPAAELAAARATVDATSALHFSLSSSGVTGKGATIVSGSGDAARPDAIAGTFTVAVDGLPVTVKVIGVGPALYVESPFTSSYARTDPGTYGIGDPTELIDPTHGLSSILPLLTSLRSGGQVRVGSEVTDQVIGTLPGGSLPVLPDADRAEPVSVTVDIVPGDHQVRRMVLRGPFTSAAASTYTVVLTSYGETVHIAAPAG